MTVLGQKFLSVLCSSCIVFCTAASSFAVQAKCVRLPDELNMQCSGEECKAGILWKSSDDKTDGKYHPRIEWTGEVESNQFEVVVVDENGRQVSWPYPLGQGLFLSMKGNFLVEGAGGRADFSLSNPSHQYGYGPLATFATSHVRNATFDFHSSQGWYTLYIMNLGGEEFEGQMVPGCHLAPLSASSVPTCSRVWIRLSMNVHAHTSPQLPFKDMLKQFGKNKVRRKPVGQHTIFRMLQIKHQTIKSLDEH